MPLPCKFAIISILCKFYSYIIYYIYNIIYYTIYYIIVYYTIFYSILLYNISLYQFILYYIILMYIICLHVNGEVGLGQVEDSQRLFSPYIFCAPICPGSVYFYI